MGIKSYTYQGTFTTTLSINGFNISALTLGLPLPSQRKSSILFNGDKSTEVGITSAASVIWDGGQYIISVDVGYVGKEFAIIDENRLAARFTLEFIVLPSGNIAHQTITSIGNNSVGPEIRRLYNLGYI